MKPTLFAWTLAAGTLATTQAFALGMLVAPAGNEAKISLSRTLIVRSEDRVRLITQIKMTTNAPKVGWLIPLTNIELPVDNGVRVSTFPAAALDELDALTSPHVTGVCPDGPTGEEHTIPFGDAWRPGQPMVNARLISAGEISNGDLTNYLQGRDYEITAAAQDAIDTMHDQNFMFAIVNLDPVAQNVDPIVAIEYPLNPGTDPRLGLYPIIATLGSTRADMLFWTLNTAQMKGNLPTNPWDLAGVQFVSQAETNYTPALESYLDGERQTQAMVLEYGMAAPAFQNGDLTTLVTDSGATHLTRMRASFLTAAVASNVRTMTFRKVADAPDSARDREIPGRECVPQPDMGAGTGGEGGGGGTGGEASGGSGGSGGNAVDPDSGPGLGGTSGSDSGVGGTGATEGGGGGGGCQLGHGLPPGLGLISGLFAVLLTTLGLRRRRL